ncbi:beta-lactamase family protein [Mucilaginibacter corticis]|uniref:Beta-lactamase family protein n=1 Tax=Mucilaginibacter corticis TaxID=2597670 RepID=A0A556MII6_9SPHI|nr:serine hydrolase domain-containing protein [Mucilaginibacter corticis]TSJ39672.1 beta-lactamase family protein [Mucilaginibacter corticis]
MPATIQFYKSLCKSLFAATLFLAATVAAYAQIPANQPVPKGFSKADIQAVDKAVNNFMQKYHVPGLSFAIAKGDSLKIRRTYGYADTAKKEKVKPSNRFRIASVSKPFTSAAIMLLIEQGKLHLTDKVFGAGGVLGTTYGSQPYKQWVTDITIQNLLEHTGGGWNRDGDDPMFLHTEMNQAQLISWAVDNMPVTKKPGTYYSYSNFGYCLLGRVIEKVSGTPYEQFIKKNILAKCGINTMQIGGNTLAEQKPDEVYYYGNKGDDDPYKMDERRMDSHGGWIATATDLVKFLVRLNYNAYKPEILTTATLAELYTPSLPGSDYAKGWLTNSDNNHWHNGSLPGEQALVVNTGSGFSWAVLVNTRTDGNFSGDLDQLMWQIKESIKSWPDVDLFGNK